jgi:hypothetical protein
MATVTGQENHPENELASNSNRMFSILEQS